MAKRIGPEAKILSLFQALPEESQRIVFDILKSTAPRLVRPKSTAQTAGRRLSQKNAMAIAAANTAAVKDSASGASGD